MFLAEEKSTKKQYALKALKKFAVFQDDDVAATMTERRVLTLGGTMTLMIRVPRVSVDPIPRIVSCVHVCRWCARQSCVSTSVLQRDLANANICVATLTQNLVKIIIIFVSSMVK